jgi:hypothetical protein
MSDLLTMQPNIDIRLYLVASDERFTSLQKRFHGRRLLHVTSRCTRFVNSCPIAAGDRPLAEVAEIRLEAKAALAIQVMDRFALEADGGRSTVD